MNEAMNAGSICRFRALAAALLITQIVRGSEGGPTITQAPGPLPTTTAPVVSAAVPPPVRPNPTTLKPPEASVPAALAYTLTNLGTLGGPTSQANAINASGQIAGGADTKSNEWHAFLYDQGKMQDLGVLSGNGSEAMGLNDSGKIVGYIVFNLPVNVFPPPRSGAEAIQRMTTHAFLFSDGKMLDLDAGKSGNLHSRANAINASGQIAGAPFDAAAFSGGKAHSIQLPDQHGSISPTSTANNARAINDSGEVAGVAEIGRGYTGASPLADAFLLDGNGWAELGTLWGQGHLCQAFGINASGQVVGWVALPYNIHRPEIRSGPPPGIFAGGAQAHSSVFHETFQRITIGDAFLYAKGTMYDLGNLGGWFSFANAINDPGQIVGLSTVADGSPHAFIHAANKMLDLNGLVSPGQFAAANITVLMEARGINRRGQIVGVARDAKGSETAFLLTPVEGNATMPAGTATK